MAADKRFPFTKTKLAGLPVPTAGRSVYYDAQTPALTLRITEKGQRSFYFYRKVKGRPIRHLLGKFPEMSVEKARNACQATSGAVAQGKDPQAERREARHEQTVGGLFAFWLDTHAKQHKRTWAEDERQYNTLLKPWANRRLSTIRKADVQALHARSWNQEWPLCRQSTLGTDPGHVQQGPGYGFCWFQPDGRRQEVLGGETRPVLAW